MDKSGLLGEILEKGQATVSDTTKAVKSQLTGFGKAAAGQVTPSLANNSSKNAADQNLGKNDANSASEKTHAKDMVKHLYGLKDDINSNDVKDKNKNTSLLSEQKKIEEQKKLKELRSRLHQEYYQGIASPPKKQEEERPAEKVEREKKQEMQELQKKEEKKLPPLAVKRAQTSTEINRGVSG